jgi:hypothetical protein
MPLRRERASAMTAKRTLFSSGRDGIVRLTRSVIAAGGKTTDFKWIDPEILGLAADFEFTELAHDRTFAGEIVRNLQDEGLSLVEFARVIQADSDLQG